MKRGMYLWSATAAIMTALAFAPGCLETGAGNGWSTVDPVGPQGDVSLYRDIQFSDIPVPPQYVISPTESYTFQGSMFRSGVLHYYGPLGWTEALEFYRQALPANGWRQESIERGFDFRVYRFTKDREQLIVTVRQIKGGSRAELQLDDVTKNDLLLKGRLPAR